MESETIISKQFYTTSDTHNDEQNITSSIFRINNDTTAKKIARTSNKLNLFVLAGTFLLMFAGAFAVYLLQDDFDQFQLDRINSTWGYPFLIVTILLFFFQMGAFLYKEYLFIQYKPIESVSDE